MERQLSVRVECPRPAREGLPPPSLHTISAIIPYLQYDCIVFYPRCHHFIRGLLLYQHRNYQRHHPPPSQTKCNHPSSISSLSPPVSPSLDISSSSSLFFPSMAEIHPYLWSERATASYCTAAGWFDQLPPLGSLLMVSRRHTG